MEWKKIIKFLEIRYQKITLDGYLDKKRIEQVAKKKKWYQRCEEKRIEEKEIEQKKIKEEIREEIEEEIKKGIKRRIEEKIE